MLVALKLCLEPRHQHPADGETNELTMKLQESVKNNFIYTSVCFVCVGKRGALCWPDKVKQQQWRTHKWLQNHEEDTMQNILFTPRLVNMPEENPNPCELEHLLHDSVLTSLSFCTLEHEETYSCEQEHQLLNDALQETEGPEHICFSEAALFNG